MTLDLAALQASMGQAPVPEAEPERRDDGVGRSPTAGDPVAAQTPGTVVPGSLSLPLEEVLSPSGGKVKVMGLAEKIRYEQAVQSYTEGVVYELRSDIEDLERLVFMELMVYRWGLWLMQGQEYDGTQITDENKLRRQVQDFAKQIEAIKDSLKLSKKARENDKGDSFDQRWRNLAAHAKEFGIMRETQLGRALETMQAIFAAVATYDRADEEERKKISMSDANAVLDVVRELRPHFDEVDAYFTTHSQKFWVRNP
jgi:hypothetical protein